MPQVSALYIYPIKSCGGISVDSASVEARGLRFDRRFMLVDENGRFLSQRKYPQMALLRTSIAADTLTVTRPDGGELPLPLQPTFGEVARVRVWRSELEVSVAGESVNRWFGDFLGHSASLVYMDDTRHRRVARQRATQAGDEVSFADAAPILLTSEGSLAELNARLRAPVTMLRFRPNVVVDETDAFAEDRWGRVAIGAAMLEPAWRCARCTTTTVDPDSGSTDPDGEPLKTLREFRREGPGIMFGQNVLVRREGTLRVGDTLDVLEWK